MSNITISNQASKIYIYNSSDEGVNKASSEDLEDIEPKNAFCDVTIHTNFTIPEYHIRIKNNYKSENIKNKHEEMSTSKKTGNQGLSNLFSINDDVLMKTDDKLYLGTIVSIQNGKYLVKFDDNTDKWATEQELKKLNSSSDKSKSEDPLCVVCKIKSENDDLVEVCNKCSRGYHRQCMPRNSSNFSSPWCCDRCTASEIISISDSEDNETEINVPIKFEAEETVPVKIELPYDVSFKLCKNSI